MVLLRSDNFGDRKSCFLFFRKSIPNDKYNIVP
jgi:hypothetical protein